MDEANKPSLPDLEYCPWCRGNPKMTETHKDHWHVQCESCGARRESSFHNQYIAADSWNSRAGDRQPAMPETVGVKALASATGTAASSKEPERDESDCAPCPCYVAVVYDQCQLTGAAMPLVKRLTPETTVAEIMAWNKSVFPKWDNANITITKAT